MTPEHKKEISILAKGLLGTELSVRRKTARALKELGRVAKVSIPSMVMALSDSDAVVREDILIALKNSGEQKLVYADVLPLLRDPIEQVRLNAVKVFRGTPSGKSEIAALLESLADDSLAVRQEAVSVLKSINLDPGEALPYLIKALRDTNKEFNREILDIIAGLDGVTEESITGLIAALPDQSDQGDMVNLAILGILEKNAESAKSAVPVLVKMTSFPNTEVRIVAARLLGRYRDFAAGTTPILEHLLEDENDKVAWTAFDSVRHISADTVVAAALIKLLGHQSLSARFCEMLGKIGPAADAAVPKLMELGAKDLKPEVRAAARSTLKALGPSGLVAIGKLDAVEARLQKERLDREIPGYIASFKSMNEEIRVQAQNTLIKIGLPVVPYLINALTEEDISVSGGVVATLRKFPEDGPAKKAVKDFRHKVCFDRNIKCPIFKDIRNNCYNQYAIRNIAAGLGSKERAVRVCGETDWLWRECCANAWRGGYDEYGQPKIYFDNKDSDD